ncbi:DUF4373 domain-containing protein [Effusibacillus dendaii]|uniref:Lin1244/Lin1753-like N-terminal domain-containing protein n=1 Tax=Effusibacillus dendaii TaxID=2743772 RepID=A0A7I8DBX7_9BACL|nr:DUF4373 domain-containing protein [Effusibacillus dendaii]BCJ86479.1 hypothetical protein skT53_14640 [Effusibacillus dendaii]
MARPVKEGMDYFSHDTDAVNDEKIEALRMLYGNDGYAFYFILLERIYRTNDFELDISDAETIQILAKKVGVTEEKFHQILQSALKWNCFDREAYEKRRVLTSSGIKKRAATIIEKRAAMREKYRKSKLVVSESETTQETIPEIPQVKKSKVKKSKVNKNIYSSDYTPEFEQFWIHYPKKVEKQAAFKKWCARLNEKDSPTAESLIEAAKNYAIFCANEKTEFRFIKHPKTFLGPSKPYEDYLQAIPIKQASETKSGTKIHDFRSEYVDKLKKAGLK